MSAMLPCRRSFPRERNAGLKFHVARNTEGARVGQQSKSSLPWTELK